MPVDSRLLHRPPPITVWGARLTLPVWGLLHEDFVGPQTYRWSIFQEDVCLAYNLKANT